LLSASFDVWQNDDAADSIPDLSININHGLETRTPHSRNRAWELDNFDIKPPDSVLCAQFERVQIRFEFLEIPKKAKCVKRAKPDTTKFDAEEEMLLDFELTLGTHREMDELAHVVEEMRGLSGLIARCFEPQLEVDDEPNLLQRTPLSTLVPRGSDLESPSVQALAESISGNGRSNRVRIRQHPKAAIEILSAWFQAHTDNPYPTKTEKLELVRNTGLNTRQWGGILCLATHTDFLQVKSTSGLPINDRGA
jgi:hypothetical protein